MAPRKGTAALTGGLVLAVLGLAACSSGPPAPAAAPPRQVTAKPAGGSAGKAPLVIASPTPLPGGKPGSQQVTLSDRTLVIKSVTLRPAKQRQSKFIDLSVAVRDNGAKAIRNESRFYELMTPEGDTFSGTAQGAGSFYDPIGSGASRSAVLQFQVPAAAAPDLFLLYRPENGADAVLTRLRVS